MTKTTPSKPRRVPDNAESAGVVANVIKEGDGTSKFIFADKHGKSGETFTGASLFDLFHVPEAIVRQLNDELQKVVGAIKDWTQKWQDHIEDWELRPRKGAMHNYYYCQFVVTHKGKEYDKKLAKALTQLGALLYDGIGCALIRVTTLMVPDVTKEEVADIWT
jgi:hypothetical protein